MGLLFWSLGDWKKANLGKRLLEFKYKPLIVPALKNHVAKIWSNDVFFHAFLNSTLYGGQLSASRPGCCVPYIHFIEKRFPYTRTALAIAQKMGPSPALNHARIPSHP